CGTGWAKPKNFQVELGFGPVWANNFEPAIVQTKYKLGLLNIRPSSDFIKRSD
ncbi:20932_t:CDS:1, partial [Cetraspora pellucida]